MSVLRSLPKTRLWLLMFDPSPPPNVARAAKEVCAHITSFHK